MGISKIDAFLNKLRLWQKFLVLAILGVLLVAAPFALYFSESGKVISSTQKELEGIRPANLFLQALNYSQQHRGLSMVVLNGDNTANAKRMQAQEKAEEAYADLSTIINNEIEDEVLVVVWHTVLESWNNLKNEVNNKSITPDSSFAKHTSMITQLIRVKSLLLQYYGLSFDPEAQGFYLIDAALEQAPMITELLGQARGMGSGLLTRGNVSNQERMQMTVLVNRSQEHQFSLTDSMENAMRQYEHLRNSLNAPSNHAILESMDAIDLANNEIINKLALNYSATEYFAKYTSAIEAQYKFIDTAIAELHNVLTNRLTNLNNIRYILSAAVIIISLLAAAINLIIIRALLRQLGGEPDYTASVLNEISHGNLAVNINMHANDNSSLIHSMQQMRDRLALMVYDIRQSADSIASASAQIVAGNLDLSSRTDQQASSLQETAATTEEITSAVQQNHANSEQANTLVINAAETAKEGGEIVSNLVQSMGEINEKSQQMSNIINVIDSIAFQTNILALNAAVEAARAGEQGRGFAVVATEVRALAQRSASAAQEIKVLIESSVTSANQGNQHAEHAGNIMRSVVEGIQSVTNIMSEINVASREQANAIAEINAAVLQMDDVTRQNASLVEESAAAAASLQEQADQLVQLVSNFRITHLKRVTN